MLIPAIGSSKSQNSGADPGIASGHRVLLWLLLPVVTAALLLRYSALGEMVLTPVESCNAWPAWASAHDIDWHAAHSKPPVTSPLLDNILWLSFQGVEASDALARAGPALFGTLLVSLPWFYRRWLGNWGTLSAMILFAFDSWQMAFSRCVDGAIVTSFFAMAILAWMERFDEAPERKPSWSLPDRAAWMVLAVILALFAASSAEFWSLLPPVAACFLLTGGWTGLRKSGISNAPPLGYFRAFPWALAGSLLLVLSFFGARWENVSALGWSLTEWLRSWGTAATHGYSPNWMLARILGEQPLTLAAGLAGLAILWLGLGETDSARARKRALALSLWILWGIILTVQGGRGPAGLLVVGLPLKLAAALALGHLISEIATGCSWDTWLTRILPAVGLLGASVLWIQRYRRNIPLSDLEVRFSVVLAASALLLFLLFRQVRFRLELITISIVALLAAELNGNWQLARQIHKEPVFFDAIGHPDLRLLESDVRQWVLHYREMKREIRVSIASDIPGGCLPTWYLRDFSGRGNGRLDEDSRRDTIIVAREGNLPFRGVDSALPAPYRVDIRCLSALDSGRRAPVQQRSEVVLLWLPRE
jgi:hypothetical protein